MERFELFDRWIWVNKKGQLCVGWSGCCWSSIIMFKLSRKDGIGLMAMAGRYLGYEISSRYKDVELGKDFWPIHVDNKTFRIGCCNFTKRELEPAFLYLIAAYDWEIT